MSNPVLVEVTRGSQVESTHTGALALAGPDGTLLLSIGDTSRTIFPRSSIKALQALPVIETGAADHFGFGEREIALACASHTGAKIHTDLAAEMLTKIGLSESALGCGAHPPLGASAARELWRAGRTPNQLHNNCSGKHAGMLATALHMNEPVDNYWDPNHPTQRRVHAILCELTERTLSNDVMGIDGCSIPNWALPLSDLARTFARIISGRGLSVSRNAALDRILSACWSAPQLIAGPGRMDSQVMEAFPGRIFLKTGAEGVYCGGFRELGLGFALKIDDGTTRASAATAMALIAHIYPEANGLVHRRDLKSWRGAVVGTIKSAPALTNAFKELKL